ncbi:MAG: capsule assembly Wzi family protein [bacterium]|nr:capsule assembly Wzi family protein [bacterium]
MRLNGDLTNLFFLSLLLFPFNLSGYSTPNVSLDSPAYRQIDKLVSFGLIDDAIYGQRPWSRHEMARMTGEAIKILEKRGPVFPEDKFLNPLKKEFHEELVCQGFVPGECRDLEFHFLEQARLDYTFLESPYRTIAGPTTQSVNAFMNPLIDYQEGRHFADGHTVALESGHSTYLTKYFSLSGSPRLEVLVPDDDATANDANLVIQNLQGKFNISNFELEIGRDSIVWGQGQNGGLLLSNNARPLDQVKLSNDSPITLPWLFKYLGPSKAAFFVADLGPEQFYSHPLLAGFKLSIKPFSFLELGASQAVILGGSGAPEGSFLEYVGEVFGIRPGIGFDTNDVGKSDENLSNRLMGLELRITIPPLRHSQIYYEMFTEACCGVFDQLYGYYGGLYIPRLTPSGTVDLRIEWVHTPPVLYTHGAFPSGWTLNQKLLGHNIGPNGDGIEMEMGVDFSERWQDTTTLAFESRGRTPDEDRYRFINTLSHQYNQNFNIHGTTGYELVNDFNTVGNRIHNFLFQIGLTYRN